MTQPGPMFAAVDALVQRVGVPAPGRPGLVVAAPGAGKTALLLHLAERAAVEGLPTVVVALGSSLGHLRAQHAAVVQAGWMHSAEVQGRLLLLAVPGQTPVDALVQQVALLRSSGAFDAARVVVDGLPATPGALGALAEGSRQLGLPAWAAMTAVDALPESLRVLAGPVVWLAGDGAAIQLRDGDGGLLPWSLDATSLRVDGATSSAAGRLRVLHGGAEGAEAAFGEAAVAAGHEERTLTWAGRTPSRAENLVVLDDEALDGGPGTVVDAESTLNRSFGDSEVLRKVLRLQASLASAADEVVVVGSLRDDGTVSGGTGWAVEVARRLGRRLWVYDQPTARWLRWTGEAWDAQAPVLVGPVVAGTGTRQLTEAGHAAIRAVLGADGSATA